MESFRNQPWLGFEVVGVYHDPKPGGVSNDWAGNLQQLVEDAKAGKIHNVYIAMQMCDGARVKNWSINWRTPPVRCCRSPMSLPSTFSIHVSKR